MKISLHYFVLQYGKRKEFLLLLSSASLKNIKFVKFVFC